MTEKDVDEALERLAKAMEVVSRSQRSFKRACLSSLKCCNYGGTKGRVVGRNVIFAPPRLPLASQVFVPEAA